MTKEQTKRDLYNNPEKTAFAMRPESETVYSQVCKLEQTGCWIDDFDKNFISGTEKGFKRGLIENRLRRGWSVEKTLEEPINIKNSH